MRFQTKSGDLVIACHGCVDATGIQGDKVVVPEFVEVWLLVPIGAILFSKTGQMIERGDVIEGLEILKPLDPAQGTLPVTPLRIEPRIYKTGEELPPIYVARHKRELLRSADGPMVLDVPDSGPLYSFWPMINGYLKLAADRKKQLRIFLSTCMELPASQGGGRASAKRVRAIDQP